jgi:tryptophan halogenase
MDTPVAQGPTSSGRALKRIVVVGGGTSGYFAALALQRGLPGVAVEVIESARIPVIGVGEATTTAMLPFLHLQLGIDPVELYREVRPTWKLGIRFDWGLAGHYSFMYPFGSCSATEAAAHDHNLSNASLTSRLMEADRSPIVVGDDGKVHNLLPEVKFAYHLQNKRFIGYLTELAAKRGIGHRFADVIDAVVNGDGETIERLVLSDGAEVTADLFVDATGFRSRLIEGALGSPFQSFADTLLCDSAVVGEVPQVGPIQPYTTAETMDAGWCWRIPIEGEDHRGYVYASAFMNKEQAEAEMRRKNPGLANVWHLKFRSGRHEHFWKGNVVAVGNAYGFVEPLESTALHMVISELNQLLGALRSQQDWRQVSAQLNTQIGGQWDYLRWFLGIHYKFNRRLHTPFWRHARDVVNVSGVQRFLDLYHTLGPWENTMAWHQLTKDPVFNHHGMFVLLLGQHAPCPPPAVSALPAAQWQARAHALSWLVERSMPQAEALAWLRDHPEALRQLVNADHESWLHNDLPHRPHVSLGEILGHDLQALLDHVNAPSSKEVEEQGLRLC